MADNNTPPPAATGFQNAEKNNAAVAAALLKQDLINAPVDTSAPSDALDKLAAQAEKDHEAAGTPPPAPDPKAAEAAAAAAAKEAAESAAKAAAEPDPAKVAAEAATKAEADAKADAFFKDVPSLPAGASVKSSEAFAAIKAKAVQEISAREAELEALRKAKTDLEDKLKNPIPPEITKELEDHREWRAKLDVDADPRFKEFDKKVAAAKDFIYAQLQKSPVVTPEVIAQIKVHGGPEFVKMDKLFEAIKDPVMQRMVESKLVDIEEAKTLKESAIKDTKANIQKYLGDKEAAFKSATTQHNTATEQRANQLISALAWNKEKPVDEKAAPDARKAAEEHNKFVTDTRAQIAEALRDDSPEMRAILITGMAQLFNLQREHKSVESELAKTKQALADVTAQWEKVKNSSTSRLRESAAAPGAATAPKPADQFNTRPADALDALAQQVMATRAAAGPK